MSNSKDTFNNYLEAMFNCNAETSKAKDQLLEMLSED